MEGEIYQRAQELQESNRRLREINEELAHRNAERAELYERLERIDRLKSELFANVSHELRTPLGLILGPVQRLLGRSALSDSERPALEMIARNAGILLKHVNDLLEVARLESGELKLNYQDIDVAKLLRETAGNFDAVAEERSISYEVSAPKTLRAQVDPERLSRVLLNLLANAFKFAPDRGAILCELTLQNGPGPQSIVITVEDNGPCVPREERERVFERFYQAGSPAERPGSTGLGLAIVRDLVSLHRGTVAIEDAVDGGALFEVQLPHKASGVVPARTEPARRIEPIESQGLAAPIVEELRFAHSRKAPSLTGVPARPSGDARPATVLVVEDNPDMRGYLCDVLRESYTVLGAGDAAQALSIVRRSKPDLIVTDIMMRGMSGDELVRELRKQSELDRVPILVITARTDDDLRIQVLKSGAQDYLVKPVLAEEFSARIANLVMVKRSRDLLQEALASTEQDLARLVETQVARQHELEEARAAAEAANRSKDEFLGVVSHELLSTATLTDGGMRLSGHAR